MHSIQSQSNIYIIVMYSAAFIYVQHVNQFIVRTHIIYTLSIQISRFFWGGFRSVELQQLRDFCRWKFRLSASPVVEPYMLSSPITTS